MIVVLGSLTCSAVCSYVESDYECEESDDSTLPPSSEDEGTGEPGMDCQESVEEMDAEDEDGDKQNVALEAVARCERPMSAARVGDKGPDRAGVRRRGKAGVRRGRGGGPGHGRGRGRGHGVAEAVTAALNEGLEGPWMSLGWRHFLPGTSTNQSVQSSSQHVLKAITSLVGTQIAPWVFSSCFLQIRFWRCL